MAKRAQMTLDTIKAAKPAAGAAASPAPAETPADPKRVGDGRKGQTIRLSSPAWAQLKHLAVDEEKAAHDLLVEAVNMLFRARNLPPIA